MGWYLEQQRVQPEPGLLPWHLLCLWSRVRPDHLRQVRSSAMCQWQHVRWLWAACCAAACGMDMCTMLVRDQAETDAVPSVWLQVAEVPVHVCQRRCVPPQPAAGAHHGPAQDVLRHKPCW